MSEETNSLLDTTIDIDDDLNDDERSTFMNRLKILGLAKSIKLWAVIEFFYDIYLMFSLFWWYIFFSFLSIGGWYGAKTLDKGYILGYFFGDIAKLIVKIIIISTVDNTVAKVFTGIAIILNLVYIRTLYKFYNILKNSTNEDLVALKEGWTPRNIYFII